MSLEDVCDCELSTTTTDHPDHLKLIRIHVSRTTAGGKAVLEGVGLDAATIDTCFRNNPRDAEEAVQDGLKRWIEGNCHQPPTWGVLLDAMEYAKIKQKYIQNLKRDLGLR